ncbi:DUF6578 domain-containing protein [Kocuria kalidii]|uniref:DUF6578 domain-containing protein n=1 Tax=Kocuria kalidii TaxID=3376283 RepID=UPI0037B8C332
MVIVVDISEWEQQCCGDPFRVGSSVTWKLVASPPGQDSGEPAARYREEHHDQTPEHVPHLPVTGAVRSIAALHYAYDPGPSPRELTLRPGSEVSVELDAVPGMGSQLDALSTDHELLTYRVHLQVNDDAVLPAYVPGDLSEPFE